MHKITEVKALEDYKLELQFSDGVGGTVDLSHLVGKGVFSVWSVARENGTRSRGSELQVVSLFLRLLGRLEVLLRSWRRVLSKRTGYQ